MGRGPAVTEVQGSVPGAVALIGFAVAAALFGALAAWVVVAIGGYLAQATSCPPGDGTSVTWPGSTVMPPGPTAARPVPVHSNLLVPNEAELSASAARSRSRGGRAVRPGSVRAAEDAFVVPVRERVVEHRGPDGEISHADEKRGVSEVERE